MASVDDCIRLLKTRGHSEYGGEPVTQLQHALQCARLAEQEGAHSTLITAALLHDVGHLLHNLPDDAPDDGVDDVHEELGYRYLMKVFGPAVADPVRMHVPAKRYLCAKDASYLEMLSPPSIVSLKLQGGPMNDAEIAEFESSKFCEDAVRLRKWDDLAKDPNLTTPDIDHYAPFMAEAAQMNLGEQ